MRLTSTGLGIGTSSPASKLHVATNTSETGVQLTNNNATVYLGAVYSANNFANGTVAGQAILRSGVGIAFSTTSGASVQATLDNSGNLGLGVTPTGTSKFELYTGSGSFNGITARFNASNPPISFSVANSNGFPYLGFNTVQVAGTDNQTYATTNFASRLDSGSGGFRFFTAPSGTAGNAITFTQAMTLDASGRLAVGTTVAFGGSTGTFVAANDVSAVYAGTSTQGVYISANSTTRDVTYNSSGSLAGGHVWQTGNTERARINTSGNLVVGSTSSSFNERIASIHDSSYTFGSYRGGTGSEGHVIFVNGNGAVGSIFTNGSVTLYNTTSDQRLKENIQDSDSSSSLIDSLQVRKFDWKANGSHQRYGFVAQELLTVAPEAVNQPEDTEEMMAVDYSKLVPMLVKEIQSLRKRLADAGI
jgi:hypothetical protein